MFKILPVKCCNIIEIHHNCADTSTLFSGVFIFVLRLSEV